MKKLAIAALALGCTAAWPAAAQAPLPAEDAARVAAIRQEIRENKRGVVEKYMQLTPEEAQRFWPIYEAYQRDLDKIVHRQNRAVLDYVNAESTLTDGNAKRIAREVLAADAEEQRLRERTFESALKALPPRKAVRFVQIENKIRAANRYDLAERVQLVR